MRKLSLLLLCFAACLLFPILSSAESAGSWAQINQDLNRPDGWRRIVEHSEFQLGDREPFGDADGQPLYKADFGGYPSLDGSTVAVPMALEFARQHLNLSDDDAQGFVFFSTTHGAYEHLILRRLNGSATLASLWTAMDPERAVDLIIATEPSDDELTLAEASGVELVTLPVCYDAFVFITHADNPVDSLTVDQIYSIYVGEITNWSEVGGYDEEITPYQREANSGSETAMKKFVLGDEPAYASPLNEVVEGMGSLITQFGNYQNGLQSLGYTFQYYIDALYLGEPIKTLAIDGVEPTPEHLRDGSYPFTSHYYAVYRAGEEDAVAGRFAR